VTKGQTDRPIVDADAHDLTPLPYHDDKPQGAADFYFAINATFRFIGRRLGEEGLRRYWKQLGEEYMAPVWKAWRRDGLDGIASYWRAFFLAEPGGDVRVLRNFDSVVLEVMACPAIHHLRAHNREITPNFCQHCYFMSEAAAQRAGYTVRVAGGNGACRQTFYPASALVADQRLEDIAEVTPN
jgi:hypothetical protein